MKRFSIVGQFALLAVIGCSGNVAPVADSPAASQATSTMQTDGDDTSTTFVSLKVPNMF